MADPNQLELAILNLCVNARDAMPSGGTLTIAGDEVLVGPGSETRLPPGLYVRLSVIDTGIGMDPDVLARAVEPFFSTKELGRGTGLGLSMVHGLTAQLGGAFTLHSVQGEGTRADLYLPVTDAVSDHAPDMLSSPLILPMRSLSILLVDDEALVRRGTSEMLRQLGHVVMEAEGGAAALVMASGSSNIDLVVTDYKMPHMDGAALARQIRVERPDLPILLISGYTGTADPIDGLPRLNKPFGLAELGAAVQRVSDPHSNVVALRSGGRPPGLR